MPHSHEYDVLIIGSGAAGLTVALNLPSHLRIAVISKADISSGATLWAQGGIAAVLDNEDSVENHIQDTLVSGGGLCHEDAVRFTVENARTSVEWLIDRGVSFTRDEHEQLHLTREGGHSHRRIIHAADATGQAVSLTLTDQAASRPNISLLSQRVAVDLITNRKLSLPGNRCVGAYVLNLTDNHVELFRARFTVIATGGASKAYRYTTNPDGASGDGIAMAWRAGCRVANMEFNQFHPTCLYHPHAKSFLISEAVRGEGGHLLLPDGHRFMDQFDRRAELAPRDIVARAIDHEMKRLGADHLLLDISHKPAGFVRRHFPTIHEKCLAYGIDITREPIPVVPAAHYTCGGVITDKRARTDISQLYVVGEAAFTGLHGANRMASNSLLECLVYGRAAAADITRRESDIPPVPAVPDWDESQVRDSDEDVVISHNWDELRHFMWDYVGIVRTTKRLQRAKHRVDLLAQEIAEFYSNYRVSNDLLELRNLVTVADLIICSALQRRESRGLHYTLDYPGQTSDPKDTVLVPTNYRTPLS
ncbi:L-aspartate oxidase [Marinobacter sp. X15-166B]|uniref:L-aspartate oxidase n=1 Tax=Marinobacter sp. X15-166B TaxID=1897620 RepID=UPI0018E9A74B|nr:L-aspartate oxidase [Marinobacter sp. X15-166B]